MTGEQAEKRYYEIYSQFMAEHVGAYSKPIVQKEIRTQSWNKLIAEIECDVIAQTLLPRIERDAMPVRNCPTCGTFRTNFDVEKCEKEDCGLKVVALRDAAMELNAGTEKAFSEALDNAIGAALVAQQPKRRGRPPKNKNDSQQQKDVS